MGMAEVKNQTYLVKRGGVYWFRRKIPIELVPFYDGKKEITFSLRTKDQKQAKEKAQFEALKSSQEFSHKAALLRSAPVDQLSADEIGRIAELYYAHLLEEDEEARLEEAAAGGVSDRLWENRDHSLAIVSDEEGFLASRSRLGDTFEEEDFAESLGVHILPESPSYVPLMVAMKAKLREALESLKKRHAGSPVATPKVEPLVLRRDVAEDTLEALYDYWAAQPAKKGGTKSRTALAEGKTVIRKFRELVGDIPPSKIQRGHVVQLKDKMLEAGSSVATINKSRGILAAIFSMALDNEKIKVNPFHGMKKLAVGESEEEKPYTIPELRAIFGSPVFSDGVRPKQGAGEAAYWIPLLGLFTGARVSEIGQLYVADVGQESGIPFILIKPDSETGRTTKDRKRRRVPLHPELVRLGFLAYVETIKQLGHRQLFPSLKLTREGGKLTDKWRDWWSRYVRTEVGITRIPSPFHGLRHSFTQHGQKSNMPYEHRMRIEGHAMNTVGDKSYGGSLYPLEPLYEAIKLLEYEGLDLSHLPTR